MDLRDYLRILRKRWLSIALITALGVALAAGYSLLSPKVYQASAQNFVAIGGSGSGTDGNNNAYNGSNFALQRVKSYTQIVDSPEVLAPVIAQLGLDTTVQQLAKQVSAENPPLTVLLNIYATDGDPAMAKELANAVAVQFARQIQTIETPQGAASSPVKVSPTNPAQVPTSPISPNTKVNIALGLILGLGAGIAYAIIREQLDTTIKSESDMSRITGATNLGLIGFDADAAKAPLVALNQQSVRAEGFRTVRTNLQYVDVDEPPKSVVITSAIPNEGKTTSACNLAITLAQAGAKVCLVEADLRKPRVADYLGIDGSVGLTSILTGQETLETSMVSWQRGLLSVIPSGPIPPNPSELLGSRQMANLQTTLREQFDAIIIDAPPLLPVTDAAVLARNADGAILVTRFGMTHRDQVHKAAEVLETVGARLLGTMLNFVPSKRSGYGYGYGYGYGGYGYADGDIDRPRLDESESKLRDAVTPGP